MADILTARLELRLGTRDSVLAWVDSMSPADRTQVSPVWIERIRASTASDPWLHGFTLVDRASGATVGSCGYKGPPDDDATVEIAYGVQPEFQGKGYATEAARALTEFALESDSVRVVRAHTLPENNASTRVLTKCGFARIGEVMDPEDGLVWRWELARLAGTG
jgi:ribosomal-protein-alanine N-acetyltransferase